MAARPVKISPIPTKAFQPGRSPSTSIPNTMALTGTRKVTSRIFVAPAVASAASLKAVYKRTLEKFSSGVVSQLEVLEDQRRALEAERAAIRAQEAGLAAWIDLKKAMGG